MSPLTNEERNELNADLVYAVKKGGFKGLKLLRAKTDRSPSFGCENCKCNRYSKCGCLVAKGN